MIYDLLIKQVITEKATAHEKEGKYQFFVRKNATKVDIRNAFHAIYGVQAAKVNVIRTTGKERIGGNRRIVTKKHEMKKVIITTKGKKTVELTKPKLK
jgi:ribosomal protein L23